MKLYSITIPLFVGTILLLVAVSGCDKPMNITDIQQLQGAVLDTSYVLIDPPFTGFSGPEDVMVGNDQLLYVADTRANRVVMLNRAGQFLSARPLLHPISLAQDSRLDLLVGGEILAPNGDTVGAIFRIHLVSASPDSAHRLDRARTDTVWRELAHPTRRFPGLTVLSDNTWLAARTGTDNSSFIDPDARVLLFDSRDAFITPLSAFATGAGSGIVNINFPTAIASFPNTRDFVLAQSSQGVAYGAIWMVYQSNSDFVGWLPRFDPANLLDRAVDFIRPNNYLSPQAVAIDPGRRDVFIADAGLDSVFKYTSRGVFKTESFGRVRSNGLLRHPTGLAFFSSVLYVLDGEQGIIFRFRLSTDVPR